MAVNKCNITKYGLSVVNQLYYGIGTPDEDLFIDNYIDYLQCEDMENRASCYQDTCFNPTIVIDCDIDIATISYVINDKTVTFFVAQEDLTGANGEVTYKWTYRSEDFDPSSPDNEAEILLTLKGDKEFEYLVTQIGVTITDADGCESTKTCYLTPEGIICIDNFAECPNPTNLQMINLVVNCGGVRNLTMTKTVD